jgi:hypothetical protein
MSDQDLVLEALEQVQRILAEHYRPGAARRPELTFDQLLLVMDRQSCGTAKAEGRPWPARCEMMVPVDPWLLRFPNDVGSYPTDGHRAG